MNFLVRLVRKLFYLLLAVIAVFIVFASFQALLYWLEGGLEVADKYAKPPLSQVFHFGGMPISKARHYKTTLRNGRSIYRMSIFDKWIYWRGIRKFPTLKHCLKPDGQESLDINQFNWSAMRTNPQAQVCLHHISAKIADPEQMVVWLNKQGFRVELYHNISVWVAGDWNGTVDHPRYPFSTFSEMGLVELIPLGSPEIGIQLTYGKNSQKYPKKYDIRHSGYVN